MKKLFLFITMLLPMVASSQSIEIDGIYYNLVSEGQQAEVTQNPSEYSGAITIPESVEYNDITYTVTSIGSLAFYYCYGLTSIVIPNSVTNIGNGVFFGCSGLTSIVIPNSVTSIGIGAFSSCSGLTSIEIPNSVTSIGNGAFSGCSGLTSVSVEKGNSMYDSRNNCNAIIETSTNTLIAGCMNSIIPNGVTSIGDYVFSGCRGLTSIEIPNSVTSIGKGAFYGCDGLTSIEIPNSVTSIGDDAFSCCRDLTTITCLATNPPSCGSLVFDEVDKSVCTLKVPETSIDLYKTADQWKDFTIIEATGIQDVKNGKIEGVKYYDLNGNQSSLPRKGLNIVRMSNGKTKKVLVK